MPGTRRVSAAQQARQAAAQAECVRRVVEQACNDGDLTVLDELLPPPTWPQSPPVTARLRPGLEAFRAAVPDARWTVLELVAAGQTVVARLEVRGHFSGPLLGLAPPGRPATLTGVAICRFAAGRLVGLWLQADLLGLLEQLAVLPPLELARAVTMAQVLHAGRCWRASARPHQPAPRRTPGPEQRTSQEDPIVQTNAPCR
jgi:hypothetical protein